LDDENHHTEIGKGEQRRHRTHDEEGCGDDEQQKGLGEKGRHVVQDAGEGVGGRAGQRELELCLRVALGVLKRATEEVLGDDGRVARLDSGDEARLPAHEQNRDDGLDDEDGEHREYEIEQELVIDLGDRQAKEPDRA
jgi:hypothetical protein